MSASLTEAPTGVGLPAKTGASKARAGYVLLILCLISALNYYDRFLIGILVEDLKRDLVLSDSQIGLLSGFAFALVYSIASIPVARSEEHTSELQSLMRISYAVFCLKNTRTENYTTEMNILTPDWYT